MRKPSKEVNIVQHLSVCPHSPGSALALHKHCRSRGYRAKCPTKNQYLENMLAKEMAAALTRNLMFVVYPKESQEEMLLPTANS